MKGEKGKARKTVRTFALASFLNDLGSDMVYPVWPLFVTQVLKANMAALGFLDGLGDALVSLSQAASGYLSDKTGKRKGFIWTGYMLGSISRLGYALSAVWPHLIPFRMMDRTGKIRAAPRDAMVADVSTDETRGRHFGLLRAMDNLGAVAGILLCILLVETLGFRFLFAAAALPSLASALVILFSIREPKKRPSTAAFQGLSLRNLGRPFKRFLFLSALFALGSFSYSFLLVYASGAGFSTPLLPVLYLLFTGSASLLSYPLGRLSDRVGRKPVLLLAFLLWAAVCVGFVAGRARWIVVLAFVLYGAHKAALEPAQKSLISELAPCGLRASCLGGFQMVTGLFAFPASMVAGMLWEGWGSLYPLYFSLILTATAAALLPLVKTR